MLTHARIGGVRYSSGPSFRHRPASLGFSMSQAFLGRLSTLGSSFHFGNRNSATGSTGILRNGAISTSLLDTAFMPTPELGLNIVPVDTQVDQNGEIPMRAALPSAVLSNQMSKDYLEANGESYPRTGQTTLSGNDLGVFGSVTGPTGTGAANVVTFRDECEASLEARRLASYPAGHRRDDNLPLPIERLDWPAPASSGVVLAEISEWRLFIDSLLKYIYLTLLY
ncbi:unnamed protein product [Protopolystoma xenopodis]|uniref:Uncharacterized protein n=1 Tax=Protopolystoma xenopodis TaxID=117903 RepID=A0A3S5ANQ6_9PLAT|nr:unnamed protein product [Protopolystoma xenopodis]